MIKMKTLTIGGTTFEIVDDTARLNTLPEVTAADNEGQILQVIDGVWTVVPVDKSAVATYIDEYISSALEGEF